MQESSSFIDFPSKEDVLNTKAFEAFTVGDLSSAEKLLRELVEEFPSAEHDNDLGAVLWKKGERFEAFYYFQKALKRCPEYSEAVTNAQSALSELSNEDRFYDAYADFSDRMNEEEARKKKAPKQIDYTCESVDSFLKSTFDDQSKAPYFEEACEVTMSLRNPCNFNCYYCVGKGVHQHYEPLNLGKIRQAYEKFGKFTVTNLECGTGEPTINPQIKPLLEICSEFGGVQIPTNLSVHPRLWFPMSTPKHTMVTAAFHPVAEENIGDFLDKVLWIKERGGGVYVSFVCHPKRLYKLENYQKFFSNYQIDFSFAPFTGEFEGKTYPQAYNEQQKERIVGNRKSWIDVLNMDLKFRDFSNIPCLTGYLSFCLNPQGTLLRCPYDPTPVENPHKGPNPCTVNYCGCGFYLEYLNDLNEAYWARLKQMYGESLPSDAPPLPSKDAIIVEKRIILRALLVKFRKQHLL